MYCLNCGELWHDCICVPWCWKHDRLAPCAACESEERIKRAEKAEKRKYLKQFEFPWYVNLVKRFRGEL